MPDFQDLLDQAATNPFTETLAVSDEKKINVARTTDQIKQAMPTNPESLDFYSIAAGRENGSGAESAGDVEKDLRTMDAYGLYAKYGSNASKLIHNYNLGSSKLLSDQLNQERSPAQALGDAVGGVTSGFVGGVGGLMQLATLGVPGPIGSQARELIGEGTNRITSGLNDLSSDQAKNAARVTQAISDLDTRDNKQAFDQDIAAGTNKILANTKRVASDFGDSLANTLDNPVNLAQGTSQAIGSLLTGGPVSKGIGKVGEGILKASEKLGATVETVAKIGLNADRLAKAQKIAEGSKWVITNAALEAGGGYQQGSQQVLDTPIKELSKTVPEWNDLTGSIESGGQGMSPEEARSFLADEVGKRVAITQGVMGAATSKLVKYAEHPFHVEGGVGGAALNIAGETLEEGLQNTTGQIAQNEAIQKYVDPNQDITEGVGEQAAQGAIYGAASAGAVQAPHALVQTPRALIEGAQFLASKTLKPVGDYLAARGQAKQEAAEEASSPVSNAAVSESANSIVSNAAENAQTFSDAVEQSDATPEQKTQTNEYLNSVVDSLHFDPKEEDLSGLPQSQQDVLNTATNKVDAIQKMALHVNDLDDDSVEQLNAASTMYQLLSGIEEVRDQNPEGLESIPKDHPANELMARYDFLMGAIDRSPAVKKALGRVRSLINNNVADTLQPVTAESIDTPEGRQTVQNAVAISAIEPSKANLNVNQTILEHAQNSGTPLTPNQRSILQASVALLKAHAKQQQDMVNAGLTRETDVVNGQILSDKDTSENRKSAAEHTKGIMQAVSQGNPAKAKALLQDFREFVQHMGTKVSTLNKHYEGGNPNAPGLTYKQLLPGNRRGKGKAQFAESAERLFVNTKSSDSLDLAQSIGIEANTLADIYNDLTDAYPQLGEKKVNQVQLNSDLTSATPEELSKTLPQKQVVPEKKKTEPTKTNENKVSIKDLDKQAADAYEYGTNPPVNVTRDRAQEHIDHMRKIEAAAKAQRDKTDPESNRYQELDDLRMNAKDAREAVEEMLRKDDAERASGAAEEDLIPQSTSVVKPVVTEKKVTPAMQDKLAEMGLHQKIIDKLVEHDDFDNADRMIKADESHKASVAKAQAEEAERIAAKAEKQRVIAENRSWMVGDKHELRDNDGRARMVFGNTSISYDLFGNKVKIYLINTPKEFRGKGEAKKALRAFLKITDAANATVQLHVAEQTSSVTSQNLIDFYTSMGFTQDAPESHDMSREIDAPEVKPKKGTALLYPNLVGGDENRFVQSTILPKEPTTTIIGDPEPANTVRDALANPSSLAAHIGKENVTNAPTGESAKAYQEYLSLDNTTGLSLGNLLRIASKNLSAYLNGKYSESDPTKKGQMLLDGKQVYRFSTGKALNIVSNIDGKLRYQPELIQSAGLAALQWMLNTNQYSSVVDNNDLLAMTGVFAYKIPVDLRNRLREGMSLEQAIRPLAQKIQSYWGFKSNSESDLAYVNGISESVAAEMLRGLIEMGLIKTDTVHLSTDIIGIDSPKDFTRYIPNVEFEEENPLFDSTDAIETAVMIEPEHVNYFGDSQIPVAQTQMNNPSVENTDDQKEALSKEQKIPSRLNTMMLDLFTSLGSANLINLFSKTAINEEDWNINHFESIDGKNRSIISAFNQIQKVVADLYGHADTVGIEPEDVDIHYAYNMSSVGRMQMLGKYNIQSDKLMREVFLPTGSKLNLNDQNGDHYQSYMLGLAQALGIKVHNITLADSISRVGKLLSGPFAPALEVLKDHYASPDHPLSVDQVNMISKTFDDAEVGITPVGLHALMDYARFQLTNESDRNEYATQIYVEADGVSNGPFNAVALMTPGQFTVDALQRLRKGGMTVGASQSLADIRQQDGKDNYEVAADDTKSQLTGLARQLTLQARTDGGAAIASLKHVFNMVSLLSKDFTYDPDTGALSIKRGFLKNPMTITIYGSGARGIAGNIVDDLTAAIYEKFSLAHQARQKDSSIPIAQAMFPDSDNPQEDFDKFSESIAALTSSVPYWDKSGVLVIKPVRVFAPEDKALNQYTFSASSIETLEENVLRMLVDPMTQGIHKTVGNGLLKTVSLIRDATQLQSIVLVDRFNKAVNAAIADKRDNDPNWKAGDFLSQKELNNILDNLQGITPTIKTGLQNFLIAGSKRLELGKTKIGFGQSLDGSMRPDPSIYAPSFAGVRAIPFLTIGMGDGMMMQILAKMGLQGTLKIFDGMHVPLDKVKDYSVLANQAAYEAIQGNPVREVLNTFNEFLKTIGDDEIRNEITTKAMDLISGFDPEITTKNSLIDITTRLTDAADSIDASHAALRSVQVSLDQMAAAAAQYDNGVVEDNQLTDAEMVEKLNEIYNQKLHGTENETTTEAVESEPTKEESVFDSVGRLHKSGVKILSWTSLVQLSRSGLMTKAQKAIFSEINRSGAARDYSFVAGSMEQILAYQKDQQIDSSSNPSTNGDRVVNGWTNVDSKTIYIVNPRGTEVVTHELIHAASFEAVLAHYSGVDLGENSAAIADAVKRLEDMMQSFITQDLGEENSDAKDAQDAINGALFNMDSDEATSKAVALNEFMAWGLSNPNTGEVLEKTKVSKISQITKNVIAAIKQLIWGRKKAPTIADDILSNLQFNAGVIIRGQPTNAHMAQDVNLLHSTYSSNSDRLDGVRDYFKNKVYDFLNGARSIPEKVDRRVLVDNAQMLSADMIMSMNSHGFPMTMTETTTFKAITTALATEASINPSVLARVQEMYLHVIKNLKVESFMADPESQDPSVRYYAQEKYDSVLGKTFNSKDKLGRSTLMSGFLGLAIVNDGFREVLSKIPVPKNAKDLGGTMDAVLTNLGDTAIDSLTKKLSGQNNAHNVTQALDNMMVKLYETAQEENTILDQYANKANSAVNRANDYLVSQMGKLADKAMVNATEVAKKSKSRIVKAGAQVVKLGAAIATEKHGAAVSQAILSNANKLNMPKIIHNFIVDLIGRTASNANIYDMIKVVRSSVSQLRQQFRDDVPRIITSKFKATLTDSQWTHLFNGFAKTDLAVLLDKYNHADIQKLFSDQAHLDGEIAGLENTIKANDPIHWAILQKKMAQLANFMTTGEQGPNLLRNAEAIARLFNEPTKNGYKIPQAHIIKMMDKLITLYAVNKQLPETRNAIASLVQTESEGLQFTLDYLLGQRTEEARKATSAEARFNNYKGYVPSLPSEGTSMMVADDSRYAELIHKGYKRVATYDGSSTDRNKSPRGYYYAPVSGRPIFNQGIFQNVQHTVNGVDSTTGRTIGMTAGSITDPTTINRLVRQMKNETNLTEALMPVYNKYGKVVALERAVDKIQADRVEPSTHLAKMIGVWRGRQVEEGLSSAVNNQLIANLWDTYQADLSISSGAQKEYVNLFDPKFLANNPIIADAVDLLTDETRLAIKNTFGKEFYVRKDLVEDTIGYRAASIGDLWTGNTRLSKDTQKATRDMLIGLMGTDAYKILVKAETTIQNVAASARNLVVVKSLIVPAANAMSNVAQLLSRGVPLSTIVRGTPNKLAEIESYTRSFYRKIEAEAELRAATKDPIATRKLKNEIQSIDDSHRRMSIWPLIEAGEFSTIADVGLTTEDINLSSGKWAAYFEKLVDQLPPTVRNAGRYAVISKDTALYRGLHKSVQYGDFIAKAILYDDLTKRKKMSKEDSLARITEEFVNYDRLPGRFRAYMENIGLFWFYNYKIRISKIALSTIRNNPLQALLGAAIPVPATPLGNVGLPIKDNFFSKLYSGSLGWSIGPGMGLRAPTLNPWFNMVN